MNVAEWIIVAILSITLMVFLIVGIILILRLIKLSDEFKDIIIESKDIARNANGIVLNVRGMTSIGGTVEMLVNKYINPRLKNIKLKDTKERKSNVRNRTNEEE